MLTLRGYPRRTCGGWTRRELLTAGGTGLLGLSMRNVWAAEATQASLPLAYASPDPARVKSVIFLFLFGGPSQLDTFDMKPDAPAEIRGPFQPIPSRTPGLVISEHLPQLAQISDKFCVVRTMTHAFNDHSGGGHYIQTGRRWHIPVGGGFSATPADWPSIGSVVEHVGQVRAAQSAGSASDLPSYAVVPNWLGRLQDAGQYRRPGQYAGWLGQACNPLTTSVDKRTVDDNPYWRDCTDEELTYQIDGMEAGVEIDTLQRRASLLRQFEEGRRRLDASPTEVFGRYRERALNLIASEATRQALDIRRESSPLRDRYGRHLFGQSCLMARRRCCGGCPSCIRPRNRNGL